MNIFTIFCPVAAVQKDRGPPGMLVLLVLVPFYIFSIYANPKISTLAFENLEYNLSVPAGLLLSKKLPLFTYNLQMKRLFCRQIHKQGLNMNISEYMCTSSELLAYTPPPAWHAVTFKHVALSGNPLLC